MKSMRFDEAQSLQSSLVVVPLVQDTYRVPNSIQSSKTAPITSPKSGPSAWRHGVAISTLLSRQFTQFPQAQLRTCRKP